MLVVRTARPSRPRPARRAGSGVSTALRATAALVACLLPISGCTGGGAEARQFRHLQAVIVDDGLPGHWSLELGEQARWTGPTGRQAVMGEVRRLSDVELELGPDPECESSEGGLYKIEQSADGVSFGAVRDGCGGRQDLLTAAAWQPYDPPRHVTDVPAVRPVQPLSTVPLDGDPRRLTYTAGSLWVASGTAPEVYRVDPVADEVVGVVDVAPYTDEIRGIGSGAEDVWFTNWVAGTVSRVDPAGNDVVATIAVGSSPTDALQVDGAVWVTNGHGGSISRIDPATDAVTDTIEAGVPGDGGPQSLVEWRGAIYVTVPNTSEIVRLDPATGDVSPFYSGRLLSRVTATPDALWTIEGLDATWVTRLGPDGAIDLRVDVGEGRRPRAVEATGDAVWVLSVGDEAPDSRVELLRVDAATGAVTRREDVSAPTPMQDLAIDGAGDVWVSTPDSLIRIDGDASA